MSALCSGYVFERYPPDAPLTEFALALALADNAHNDGTHIFIGIPAMAVKARQSTRSVKANLQSMLARGWLIVTRPGRGRGRWPEYHINPDWIKGAALAPLSRGPDAVDNPAKGEAAAPFPATAGPAEKVQTATRKGANGDTPYRTDRTEYPPTPQGGTAGGHENLATGDDLERDLRALIDTWPAKRVELTRVVSAWRRIAPDAPTAARILAAARAKCATPEWKEHGGQYAPHLHKWLRRRSWLNPDVADALAAEQRASDAPCQGTPTLTREQMALNKQRARDLLERYLAEPRRSTP